MNSQPNSLNNGQAQNVQSGGDDRNHPDSEKVRRFVQEKIYEYLILRGQQYSSNFSTRRMIDLTRLFDKALFNAASTLDEYMNVDTLEVRLISYLKQFRNRHRLLQQQQQMNQRLLQQQQMNQRLLQQQQQMNQRLFQQQQQMNQRLLQQQQQMNQRLLQQQMNQNQQVLQQQQVDSGFGNLNQNQQVGDLTSMILTPDELDQRLLQQQQQMNQRLLQQQQQMNQNQQVQQQVDSGFGNLNQNQQVGDLTSMIPTPDGLEMLREEMVDLHLVD